jgi:hypothetical protein
MHSHATFANRIAVLAGVAMLAITAFFSQQSSRSVAGHGRSLQAATTDVGFEVFRWITIVVLVGLSGTFSGLTLGLLGLDTNQLAVSVSWL